MLFQSTMPAKNLSIGVYEKALPESMSWSQRLELAREIGFDYLELSIDESVTRLSRLDRTSSERHIIRQAMASTGFPILSLCLSAHRKYALGSASSEMRLKARQILREAIELAAELGIRIIQLAGYYVYYEDESQASQQNYQNELYLGVSYAAKHGVLLGIENMDTMGITSLKQALQHIRAINSPWLQLYPDIGNLTERAQDTLDELEVAKGHMLALHIKDTRPGEPRRVAFGEGKVPFEDAFRCLARQGFAGPVLVEMWNDNAADSVQKVQAARSWVVQRMMAANMLKDEL